jgi:L-threonylcarbamoyladenylate synthase
MARIVPATTEWISEAAEVIRSGGLVAFPTETVYGLGANALNWAAVESIFAAKGRPAHNPVIVHIASADQLDDVAVSPGIFVSTLADAFWPGPLTLVLPKRECVPDVVTGGGSTVGVRVPNHLVALELLRKSGVPIAAPSANRSESVSPTRADHVAESLGAAVDLILDGGPCLFGIESTVLDVSADPPTILRPGAITAAQIARAILVEPRHSDPDLGFTGPAGSPGRMRRHYAPLARLQISSDALDYASRLDCAGVITHLLAPGSQPGPLLRVLPDTPQGYARMLYAALRELDLAGAKWIFVQAVPQTPEWLAVRDRLQRAAEPRSGAV